VLIHRKLELVMRALARAPVVALVGPRQVGKTTLAHQIAANLGLSTRRQFDLEKLADRTALTNPDDLLAQLGPGLTIFDEVQFVPTLFQALRVAVDDRRIKGERFGQFLVLGSASLTLLQSASESLAGRIEVVELAPFSITELGTNESNRLWLRGGFPESFLAGSDADSMSWREQFIQSYLARDIPQFAPRLPRETLGRFWTMLAHLQGSEFNASQLARNLDASAQSISRYLDLLCDLFLLRRLPAFSENVGKRLRKSPKIYVRDAGLVHALLGIHDATELLGHPVVGTSFEGFVIEHLIEAAGTMASCCFYRTHDGAEIDLIIEVKNQRIAIEIKRAASSKPRRGFHTACADIKATKQWLVHGADKSFPLQNGVLALTLEDAMNQLHTINSSSS
jgi:uncharacterized protein